MIGEASRLGLSTIVLRDFRRALLTLPLLQGGGRLTLLLGFTLAGLPLCGGETHLRDLRPTRSSSDVTSLLPSRMAWLDDTCARKRGGGEGIEESEACASGPFSVFDALCLDFALPFSSAIFDFPDDLPIFSTFFDFFGGAVTTPVISKPSEASSALELRKCRSREPGLGIIVDDVLYDVRRKTGEGFNLTFL
jgi:hypothetical protein